MIVSPTSYEVTAEQEALERRNMVECSMKWMKWTLRREPRSLQFKERKDRRGLGHLPSARQLCEGWSTSLKLWPSISTKEEKEDLEEEVPNQAVSSSFWSLLLNLFRWPWPPGCWQLARGGHHEHSSSAAGSLSLMGYKGWAHFWSLLWYNWHNYSYSWTPSSRCSNIKIKGLESSS